MLGVVLKMAGFVSLAAGRSARVASKYCSVASGELSVTTDSTSMTLTSCASVLDTGESIVTLCLFNVLPPKVNLLHQSFIEPFNSKKSHCISFGKLYESNFSPMTETRI
jgi:hypothetical protein